MRCYMDCGMHITRRGAYAMAKLIDFTVTVLAVFCIVMFCIGAAELAAYMAGAR